jgi:ketopantoate reductase
MKILMLGAGAVGLSVAAKLSGACEVRAVARSRCAKAIEAEGFRLTGIWGEGNYRFPVGEGVPEGESFDYAILSSKAIDTREICEQFSSLLRGTETVSLQNGIGNEEIIAEYTDKVIGGTIITGSEWRGDSAVQEVSFIVIRMASDGDISRRGPPGVPSVVIGAAVIGSPQFVVSSSMVSEAHHFELSPGQLDPGG